MTENEIIALAFTRNLQASHIKQADIDIAKDRYVDAYIQSATAGTFYNKYCKPVIAFGVAVDIFDRIATEVTDRGVVAFNSQGAAILAPDNKRMTKREFARQRDYLIKLMIDNAEDAGFTLVDEDLTVEPIYTYYDETSRRNRI